MPSLKDAIAALEPKVAGNPAAMLGMARWLLQDGQAERALDMCRAALALAPQDHKLAVQAKTLINATVPRWHFRIVRDAPRNAAYDAALRRAVFPGARVLDIGTGSGLLAMMAARAGAAEVIACEMKPAIAAQAREIVRRNGYADRVRVIARHSDTLDVAADLGGPVDIIVSEIVSNNLLGEHVLPTHEHAARHLLKPGGQVIPARGAMCVALAEDGDPQDADGLHDISGFDLSALAALARPTRAFDVGDRRISLRSAPADLFTFDFASSKSCPPVQAFAACRSTGGRVNGIAQWIRLELDEVVRYENRPAVGATSSWDVRFCPFPELIETTEGQDVRINGSHDRSSVAIWL